MPINNSCFNENIEDNVEQEVYSRMCSSCPNARRCHEDCETCDSYDRAIRQALASLKGGK
jgi:hypothetical protein